MLLTVFVGCLRIFLLFLLVVFSLFLSAVSEASRNLFCWLSFRCGYRLSRKLFVGRLRSSSLFSSAAMEAYLNLGDFIVDSLVIVRLL